ncbi:MAG: fibronectin type III domain-containing protein, partial [Gammaproteobacteria bacterium]
MKDAKVRGGRQLARMLAFAALLGASAAQAQLYMGTPPSNPMLQQNASAPGTSLNFSWTAGTSTDPDNTDVDYIVHLRAIPDPYGSDDDSNTFPSGVTASGATAGNGRVFDSITSVVFTNLQPSTTYEGRVRGEDFNGELSVWSSNVMAATAITAPSAPRIRRVHLGDRRFRVFWDPPTSIGAPTLTAYKVRWTTAAAPSAYLNPGGMNGLELPITLDTHPVFRLTNGVEYRFEVAAVNTAGASGWATDSATPDVPALSTPETVVVVEYLDDNRPALRVSVSEIAGSSDAEVAVKLASTPFWSSNDAQFPPGVGRLSKLSFSGNYIQTFGPLVPGAVYDVRARVINTDDNTSLLTNHSKWAAAALVTVPLMPALPKAALTAESRTIGGASGLRLRATGVGIGRRAEFQLRNVGERWPAVQQHPYLADANISGVFAKRSAAEWALDVSPLKKGVGYEARVRLVEGGGNALTYGAWSDTVLGVTENDARLSALVITNAADGAELALSPAFTTGIQNYTLDVARGVTSIKFRATAAASVDDLTIRRYTALTGSDFADAHLALGSGNLSNAASLGDVDVKTRFSVVIDGANDDLEYFIVAKRLRYSDNALSSLVVTDSGNMTYALTPAFHPDTLNYSLLVPSAVTSIMMTPTLRAPAVSIFFVGTTNAILASGMSTSIPLTLNIGACSRPMDTYIFCRHTVNVEPEAGTSRIYAFAITRAEAPPAPKVSLQALNNLLRIGWNKPVLVQPEPVQTHRIRWRVKSPAGSWKNLAGGDDDGGSEVAVPAITTDITGLSNATEYDVQVRAESKLEQSDWVQVSGAPSSLALKSQPELFLYTGVAIAHVTLPELSSGGTPPYAYELSGLPSGLVFTEATRLLTGTPAAVAELSASPLTYTATDSSSPKNSAVQLFTVSLTTAPTFAATPANLTYNYRPAVNTTLPALAGGFPPYEYALTGALPAGLSFDPQTRILSGAPATVSDAVPLVYTAKDERGRQGFTNGIFTANFTLKVNPIKPDNMPPPRLLAGDAQISVSWDKPSIAQSGGVELTGYRLRWSAIDFTAPVNPGGEDGFVVPGGANANSYIITGLENGERYQVAIWSVNSVGSRRRNLGSETETRVDMAAPSRPRQLTVTRGNSGELRLNWAEPEFPGSGGAITRYLVRWAAGADSSTWVNPSAANGENAGDATATAYTIRSLSNATTYAVQIAADNSTRGAFTESALGTPAEVLAFASEQRAVHFRTDRATSITLVAATGGITPLSYELSGDGLLDGLALHATTRALSGTPAAAGDGVALYKVTDAHGVFKLQEFDVSAGAAIALPSQSDIAVNFGEALDEQLPAASGGTEPFMYDLDGGLPAGITFNSAVAERRLAGAAREPGNWTLTYTATDTHGGEGGIAATTFMLGVTAIEPSVPGGLALVPGAMTLAASWDASENPGDIGEVTYQVQWKISTALAYATGDISMASADLSYEITGLDNTITYDVQVRAFNDGGSRMSAWSAALRESPAVPTKPSAPRNPAVISNTNKLLLTWDAPEESGRSGAVHYDVRWKLTSAANYAAADLTEDLSELRGVISGLTATTAYTLQVRAGNNLGDSAWADASASTGRNKLDVNASGDADWRDGILLARYAFGLRGDALADGTFNTAAAAAIISNIEGAASLLNVDGVGNDMSAADG